MMASAFGALAEELCAPAALRAAFEAGGGADATRWQRLAELGLAGVLGPESAGGMGLTLTDFILIAESAGRAALPDTLLEHAGIGVPLLAEFAADARVDAVLRDAIAGRARLAVSHPANPFMLGAGAATHLLVMTDCEVHLLRREQVVLEPHRSVDALRSLSRLATPLDPATCLARGALAAQASARAFERGAVLAAAECVGLCERMLSMAVAYAGERTQFGKKIGSYQTLKHQLANVQVKLEFCRPVLYAAATRAGALDGRSLLSVSHAKLAAVEAADLAARTALQVHGAMGYSWEVDLHFFMKRAWALSGAWGDRSLHMRRVQAQLFTHHLAIGPEQMFVLHQAPGTA